MRLLERHSFPTTDRLLDLIDSAAKSAAIDYVRGGHHIPTVIAVRPDGTTTVELTVDRADRMADSLRIYLREQGATSAILTAQTSRGLVVMAERIGQPSASWVAPIVESPKGRRVASFEPMPALVLPGFCSLFTAPS